MVETLTSSSSSSSLLPKTTSATTTMTTDSIPKEFSPPKPTSLSKKTAAKTTMTAMRMQQKASVGDRSDVLKEGDFVRVSSSQRQALLGLEHPASDRLGRVARVVSARGRSDDDDDDDDHNSASSFLPSSHPFRYDIECMIGERLTNVERCNLIRTTAEAEGLSTMTTKSTTNETRKRGLKRKASGVLPLGPLDNGGGSDDDGGDDESNTDGKKFATSSDLQCVETEGATLTSAEISAPNGKSGRSQRKNVAVEAMASTAKKTKKSLQSSSFSKKETKKTKTKKKTLSTTTMTTTAPTLRKGKGCRRSRRSDVSNDVGESADSSETAATAASGGGGGGGGGKPSAALDMYHRHRKEFERSLVRLERTDGFGFFLGKPLPGFEERYFDEDGSDNGDDSGENDGDSDLDGRKPVTFPSTPPFNFSVIRKRKRHGRYVLDRVRMEAEHNDFCSKFMGGDGAWMKDGTRPSFDEKARRESVGLDGSHRYRDCECDGSRSASFARRVLHRKGVHWDLFRDDIMAMCDSAISRDPSGISGGTGTLGNSANKIKEVMEQIYNRTGHRQLEEMTIANAHHKFNRAVEACENKEAAMQGKWRKHAFPERRYERLTASSVVCAGLSAPDERSAIYELETSLPDSFVGLSYTFDDTSSSEAWMKSVVDETAGGSRRKKRKKPEEREEEKRAALALAADDGVVRAQVKTAMDVLLIGVQDRVMTDMGVLKRPEMRSANWEGDHTPEDAVTLAHSSNGQLDGTVPMSPDIREPPEVAEQSVWGLDCYSRRNVEICLEMDFSSSVATEFIEKWLLPAINSCPVESAHNIACAARVLEGLPLFGKSEETARPLASSLTGAHVYLSNALNEKIRLFGPPWLQAAAKQIRIAAEALGENFFRIHPKGHGSVVIRKDGIKANTLITYYRGEVYPPWRWGEKLDAIEQTQKRLGLRPNLPDFYNMALERPRVDPRGFGLLFVDASRKAGLGSSFSHSCEPTCEVRVVAKDGKLSLAMASLRDLERGEELTFDYNAVTESLHEYHYAICLCGHRKCRGSFLHFAAADCYQQVLNRNSPIAIRFSNLVKGCMKKVMSIEDEKKLKSHGFGTAAFGAVSFNHYRGKNDEPLDSMNYIPIWLRTFVADTLRYIEYERRALPVALLCNHFSQNCGKLTPGRSGNDQKKKISKKKPKKKESSKKPKVLVESNPDNLAQKVNGSNSDACQAQQNTSNNEAATSDGNVNGSGPGIVEDSKPISGSKPENTFLYYSRHERMHFINVLEEQGLGHLKGLDQQKELQKIAGSTWKALSDDMKQYWKEKVLADWELNGGREKAKEEEARKALLLKKSAGKQGKSLSTPGQSKRMPKDCSTKKSNLSGKRKLDDTKSSSANEESLPRKKSKRNAKGESKDEVHAHQISFQAADAEGWSAMEQRIHQLTQTLSRVGRVLDRHRERFFETRGKLNRSTASAALLRNRIPSPLKIVPDQAIVGWMFNNPEGIVRTFIRMIKTEPWSTTPLPQKVSDSLKGFSVLECFPYETGKSAQRKASRPKISPSDARQLLSTALLTFRSCIFDTLRSMDEDVRRYEKEKLELENEKKQEERVHRKQERKARAAQKKAEQAMTEAGSKTVHIESSMESDMKPINVAIQPVAAKEDVARNEGDTQKPQHHGSTYLSEQKCPPTTNCVEKVSNIDTCNVTDSSSPPQDKITEHPSTHSVKKAGASKSGNDSKVRTVVASKGGEKKFLTQKNGTRPWTEQMAKKSQLEAASDLLLLYAHTHTFFSLQLYSSFESSPVEVYARELGNAVPRTLVENVDTESKDEVCNERSSEPSEPPHAASTNKEIDAMAQDQSKDDSNGKLDIVSTVRTKRRKACGSCSGCQRQVDCGECACCLDKPKFGGHNVRKQKCKLRQCVRKSPNEQHHHDIDGKEIQKKVEEHQMLQTVNPDITDESAALCEPDDVITSVTVSYSGDYVLSSLLQWFTGGIGLKPGLPDMTGCILLPTIDGCFHHVEINSTGGDGVAPSSDGSRVSSYQAKIRPKLVEWFEDSYQRGSPWPEEISLFFTSPATTRKGCLMMGSPILDFLVTGDETNILYVLHALRHKEEAEAVDGGDLDSARRKKPKKSTTERLQSTVDEGMPQNVAVANWVQCENPQCMKWRKLPWHVDVDVLPEIFYCENNVWNPNAKSCSDPEDLWDSNDAPVQNTDSGNSIPEKDFFVGARFDVLRIGKQRFTEGVVASIDSISSTKRVLFHFPRMSTKWDEWIEMNSSRIAPHMSYSRFKLVDKEASQGRRHVEPKKGQNQGEKHVDLKKRQKQGGAKRTNSGHSKAKEINVEPKKAEAKKDHTDSLSTIHKKTRKAKAQNEGHEVKKQRKKEQTKAVKKSPKKKRRKKKPSDANGIPPVVSSNTELFHSGKKENEQKSTSRDPDSLRECSPETHLVFAEAVTSDAPVVSTAVLSCAEETLSSLRGTAQAFSNDQMKEKSLIAKMKHSKTRKIPLEGSPKSQGSTLMQIDTPLLKMGAMKKCDQVSSASDGAFGTKGPSPGEFLSQTKAIDSSNRFSTGQVFKGELAAAETSSAELKGISKSWEDRLSMLAAAEEYSTKQSIGLNTRPFGNEESIGAEPQTPRTNGQGDVQKSESAQNGAASALHNGVGKEQQDQETISSLRLLGDLRRPQDGGMRLERVNMKREEQIMANFLKASAEIPSTIQEYGSKVNSRPEAVPQPFRCNEVHQDTNTQQSFVFSQEAQMRAIQQNQDRRRNFSTGQIKASERLKNEFVPPKSVRRKNEPTHSTSSAQGDYSGYVLSGSRPSGKDVPANDISPELPQQICTSQQSTKILPLEQLDPLSPAKILHSLSQEGRCYLGCSQLGSAPSSIAPRQAEEVGCSPVRARPFVGPIQQLHYQQASMSLPRQNLHFSQTNGANPNPNPLIAVFNCQANILSQHAHHARFRGDQHNDRTPQPSPNSMSAHMLNTGMPDNVMNQRIYNSSMQPSQKIYSACAPQGQRMPNSPQTSSGGRSGTFPWPAVPRGGPRS